MASMTRPNDPPKQNDRMFLVRLNVKTGSRNEISPTAREVLAGDDAERGSNKQGACWGATSSGTCARPRLRHLWIMLLFLVEKQVVMQRASQIISCEIYGLHENGPISGLSCATLVWFRVTFSSQAVRGGRVSRWVRPPCECHWCETAESFVASDQEPSWWHHDTSHASLSAFIFPERQNWEVWRGKSMGFMADQSKATDILDWLPSALTGMVCLPAET